ncbi:hypothetical protein, partial [Paramuribaculum intestinale]
PLPPPLIPLSLSSLYSLLSTPTEYTITSIALITSIPPKKSTPEGSWLSGRGFFLYCRQRVSV